MAVDIAALFLACSVHPDDALLSAIAHVYGRGNPYVITDVSLQMLGQDDAGGELVASSPTAARAAVRRILARGGEPVVGLLPVRPQWAEEFGMTWEALFDGCADVQVASAKVSELDYACRADGRRFDALARRACTLNRFGASLGLPALRRAVLADLTLPRAFSLKDDADEAAATAPQTNSGLFFAAVPTAPAHPLLPEADAPPLEARP